MAREVPLEALLQPLLQPHAQIPQPQLLQRTKTQQPLAEMTAVELSLFSSVLSDVNSVSRDAAVAHAHRAPYNSPEVTAAFKGFAPGPLKLVGESNPTLLEADAVEQTFHNKLKEVGCDHIPALSQAGHGQLIVRAAHQIARKGYLLLPLKVSCDEIPPEYCCNEWLSPLMLSLLVGDDQQVNARHNTLVCSLPPSPESFSRNKSEQAKRRNQIMEKLLLDPLQQLWQEGGVAVPVPPHLEKQAERVGLTVVPKGGKKYLFALPGICQLSFPEEKACSQFHLKADCCTVCTYQFKDETIPGAPEMSCGPNLFPLSSTCSRRADLEEGLQPVWCKEKYACILTGYPFQLQLINPTMTMGWGPLECGNLLLREYVGRERTARPSADCVGQEVDGRGLHSVFGDWFWYKHRQPHSEAAVTSLLHWTGVMLGSKSTRSSDLSALQWNLLQLTCHFALSVTRLVFATPVHTPATLVSLAVQIARLRCIQVNTAAAFNRHLDGQLSAHELQHLPESIVLHGSVGAMSADAGETFRSLIIKHVNDCQARGDDGFAAALRILMLGRRLSRGWFTRRRRLLDGKLTLLRCEAVEASRLAPEAATKLLNGASHGATYSEVRMQHASSVESSVELPAWLVALSQDGDGSVVPQLFHALAFEATKGNAGCFLGHWWHTEPSECAGWRALIGARKEAIDGRVAPSRLHSSQVVEPAVVRNEVGDLLAVDSEPAAGAIWLPEIACHLYHNEDED